MILAPAQVSHLNTPSVVRCLRNTQILVILSHSGTSNLFHFLLPIFPTFPTYCVAVLTLSLGVQISYQNLQTRPFQHRKNAVVKMTKDRIS